VIFGFHYKTIKKLRVIRRFGRSRDAFDGCKREGSGGSLLKFIEKSLRS